MFFQVSSGYSIVSDSHVAAVYKEACKMEAESRDVGSLIICFMFAGGTWRR